MMGKVTDDNAENWMEQRMSYPYDNDNGII